MDQAPASGPMRIDYSSLQAAPDPTKPTTQVIKPAEPEPAATDKQTEPPPEPERAEESTPPEDGGVDRPAQADEIAALAAEMDGIGGNVAALIDALKVLKKRGSLKGEPLKQMIAAVSVGIYQGEPVLDLDYLEDSAAETDLNVVMTNAGGFIEVQGTAEGAPFQPDEFNAMLALAQKGMNEIFELQQAALVD